MPRIHPAHLKGNIAVSSLKSDLAQIGIFADEIKSDYGEDLVLQTNLRNVADSFAIRIQVKYTTFKKNKKNLYSGRFSRAHLWRWISHSDPVFICLYDSISGRHALINPKSKLSLWKIATTRRKSLLIYFSDADIIKDKESLLKIIWDARVSYYSAKIAQLEANFLYDPIETKRADDTRRRNSLRLEIGVLISAFMRAVGIISGNKFDPVFVKYVTNTAHNLAKDGLPNLESAFALAVLARVNDVTETGLPRNLFEQTTALCGHYFRNFRPLDWKKFNRLYPEKWFPFGIGKPLNKNKISHIHSNNKQK